MFLRWLVDDTSIEYKKQLDEWYIPHLIGEWLTEDQFVTSRTALYENIAAARVMRALVRGKLKAFVLGETPNYILQVQPRFWQPQADAFNADALSSGVVTANPFGMDACLDIPAEAVGRTLLLTEGKAVSWLKLSPKLHRIHAPGELLAKWYDAIEDDDPLKRSIERLRLRARKDLRMKVSERQIDRLVAGEGRKPGRPHSGKTPIAA